MNMSSPPMTVTVLKIVSLPATNADASSPTPGARRTAMVTRLRYGPRSAIDGRPTQVSATDDPYVVRCGD